MFTKETEHAICCVAEVCCQDLEYEYASDAEAVAELALDADRLTTFGYPKADAEVHALVKEHGWNDVLKAAAKIVPTA